VFFFFEKYSVHYQSLQNNGLVKKYYPHMNIK